MSAAMFSGVLCIQSKQHVGTPGNQNRTRDREEAQEKGQYADTIGTCGATETLIELVLARFNGRHLRVIIRKRCWTFSGLMVCGVESWKSGGDSRPAPH